MGARKFPDIETCAGESQACKERGWNKEKGGMMTVFDHNLCVWIHALVHMSVWYTSECLVHDAHILVHVSVWYTRVVYVHVHINLP